eukprot:1161123-Pelagomonas_calceolata.AAC.5
MQAWASPRGATHGSSMVASCMIIIIIIIMVIICSSSCRPGQYQEGNAWIKHGSHRYQAPPSPQRVHYKRNPSAPSIPARNQSYGYEDTGLGELVQQRPTEPITSGMGSRDLLSLSLQAWAGNGAAETYRAYHFRHGQAWAGIDAAKVYRVGECWHGQGLVQQRHIEQKAGNGTTKACGNDFTEGHVMFAWGTGRAVSSGGQGKAFGSKMTIET